MHQKKIFEFYSDNKIDDPFGFLKRKKVIIKNILVMVKVQTVRP